MAWMTREDSRRFSRMPLEADMDALTYWVTRLEPLIRQETGEEIIVVFCNRSGSEGQVTYAGSSVVLGILDGEVNVYGLLGRGAKELLVVDTSNPPFAKLVHQAETPPEPLSDVFTGKPEPTKSLDTAPGPKINDASCACPTLQSSHGVVAGGETHHQQLPPDSQPLGISTPIQDNIHTQPAANSSALPAPSSVTPPGSIRTNATDKPRVAPPSSHSRPARIYNPDSARSSKRRENPSSVSIPGKTPSASFGPKIIIPESALPSSRTSGNGLHNTSSEIPNQPRIPVHQASQLRPSRRPSRSNRRPPEDSTSYPGSRSTSRGLPVNPSHRSIFNRYPHIAYEEDTSLLTPFSALLSVHSPHSLEGPDSALPTPTTGGGWLKNTSTGSHSMPLLWPVPTASEHASSASHVAASSTLGTKIKEVEAPHAAKLATQKEAVMLEPRVLETAEKQGIALERPSSTKCRSVLSSPDLARPNSALEAQAPTSAVLEQLNKIARRARSQSRTYDISTSNAPLIAPKSALSRADRIVSSYQKSKSTIIEAAERGRTMHRTYRLETRRNFEEKGEQRSTSADSTRTDILHYRQHSHERRSRRKRSTSNATGLRIDRPLLPELAKPAAPSPITSCPSPLVVSA